MGSDPQHKFFGTKPGLYSYMCRHVQGQGMVVRTITKRQYDMMGHGRPRTEA